MSENGLIQIRRQQTGKKNIEMNLEKSSFAGKPGAALFCCHILERFGRNWFKPKHTKKVVYEKFTKTNWENCTKS